jgi:Peptidase family M23
VLDRSPGCLLGSCLRSANPVRVIHRRTTSLLVATLVTAAAFVAGSAASLRGTVPALIFPVVGQTTYHDDFGAPRPQGPHQGNDLLAARLSPAVAAESGKVKFWTKSASAGCMLYLYGKSGTTYLYIHLNNDLTDKHDNKGKCVAGTAYMTGLKDGATVGAGQQIGFVGDSGDAEGTYHLHFEVHPNGGAAVSPFPYLQKAAHLLVPVNAKTVVTLSVAGKVTHATADRLTIAPSSVILFPGSQKAAAGVKSIVLTVPGTTQIDAGDGTLGSADSMSIADLAGRNVVVLTAPAKATLTVALAKPGAISAARIAAVALAGHGGP